MNAFKKIFRVLFRRRRLKSIPINSITVPETPDVPSGDSGLDALAASISRNGLLSPLIVRKNGRVYELICGRRRFRAAKMCGLKRVPCSITGADDGECAVMRLSEDLHRRTPDFLEVALGLQELVSQRGFSIEEAALCTGLTQAQVTGKLRTLLLPLHMLLAIRDSGLTERHALALLRISSQEIREAALCEMAYNDMGPEAAEKYVDKLLRIRTPQEVPGQRPLYIVKDVRMFLNSISHGMDMMQGGGIDAECIREDSDNCIKLTIRIPQTAPKERQKAG